MRTLDDLESYKMQQMGATPLPATAMMSTPYPAPMTPMQVWQQNFQGMSIAAHQAYGLQQTQQWNINNPVGVPGMGVSPAQMTSAHLASLRAGAPAPPPPLMSTPGATGMFHSPADALAQNQLMLTSAFLDPNRASSNLAAMRVRRWGQDVGSVVGTVAGAGLGMMIGGGGLMGWGAGVGGSVGGALLGSIGDVPGLGHAARFFTGMGNENVAEQLSWMAGAQHVTHGRVMMGPRDVGLGGRGLSMEASMRLGSRLRSMSQATGGELNQMDMMNLTQAAGDVGLLEAAVNIDQIASTVNNLMKIVGKLGRLTGDPDFRNNLREFSNFQRMGFTAEQAVQAMGDVGRFARMAGMTRGQMGQVLQVGSAQGVAAGLTGAVGGVIGAHAAAQENLLRGAFTPIQKNLYGDIGQVIRESQMGFLKGPAQLMIPSLLEMQDGQIRVSQERMQELIQPGRPIDIRRVVAQGQQNLMSVARQYASQHNTGMQESISRILGMMPEFTAQLGQGWQGAGIEAAQVNVAMGLRPMMGGYNALLQVTGSHEAAIALEKRLRNPNYMRRRVAQSNAEIQRIRLEARQAANARAAEFAQRRGLFNLFGDDEEDDEPVETQAIDREMRLLQEQADKAAGIKTFRLGGTASGLDPQVVEELTGGIDWETQAGRQLLRRGGFSEYARLRAGDIQTVTGAVTKAERQAYRRMMGWEGTLWGGVVAAIETTDTAARRMSLETARSEKTITSARKLSRQQFLNMESQLYGEFERVGGDGAGASTLAVLKDELITKIAARGRVGQGTNLDQVLEMIRMSLSFKVGKSKANAILAAPGNEEFFKAYAVKVVQESGNEDANKSFDETLDVADSLAQNTIEQLEKQSKDLTKDLVRLFERGKVVEREDEPLSGASMKWGAGSVSGGTGRTTGKGFTDFKYVHQREAYRALVNVGRGKDAADKRMMFMLVTAARKAPDAETRQRAEEEMLRIRNRGTEDQKRLLGEVEQSITGLSEKALGTAGRLYGGLSELIFGEGEEGDYETLREEVQKGFAGEKGARLGALGNIPVMVAIEKELKKRAGGTVPTDKATSGAPDPKAEKQVETEKKKLEYLKEMRDAWTGDEGIGKDLKDMTVNVNSAMGLIKDTFSGVPKSTEAL